MSGLAIPDGRMAYATWIRASLREGRWFCHNPVSVYSCITCIYFKVSRQENFTSDTLIIWLGDSRSTIPAGVAGTLDKMARGRWFTASLIRTGLLQQSGNGTSRALEVPMKKRDWPVSQGKWQFQNNPKFKEIKLDCNLSFVMVYFSLQIYRGVAQLG